MKRDLKLVVAGVGLIGRRHAESIDRCSGVELSAIVDPSSDGRQFAQEIGKPWFASLAEMFADLSPDGVVLATPNQVHVENGLECINARCAVLVEKPIAPTAAEAEILVKAAQNAGIPLLVGHHRRHNQLMRIAKEIIASGRLGELRAVHGICWMYKPDNYFEQAPWRKAKGAGPIAVNLVHDLDLIRFLCGDVVSVHAQSAPSIRGYENEDVAAALLTFESGAIGTITVSDVIVSPWSWELTARENPKYPPTNQSCYQVGGSLASMSLPDLTVWENHGERSWWEPISGTVYPRDYADPLLNQIQQFAAVIRGDEPPLVSGEEGLKTIQVLEAIQKSASTGKTVLVASGQVGSIAKIRA